MIGSSMLISIAVLTTWFLHAESDRVTKEKRRVSDRERREELPKRNCFIFKFRKYILIYVKIVINRKLGKVRR